MQKQDREMWFAFQEIKTRLEATPKKKIQDQHTHFRNCLVESNTNLVPMIVNRHRHNFSGIPDDDLIQVGTLGLISAVEQFDPFKGIAFSTYAVPFILGRMRQYLRDKARIVRLNQSVQEKVWTYKKAKDTAKNKLGINNPTLTQIRKYMTPRMQAVTEEEWARCLSFAESTECYSYDNTLNESDELDHSSRMGKEDDETIPVRRYRNSIFKKDARIRDSIKTLKQMSIF